MQLKLSEMYSYTPRQFQNFSTGYLEKDERKTKEGLYSARWISYWSAIGFLKKGTKPEQLMTFPWEQEKKKSEAPTAEEVQRTIDFWKKVDAKRNGKTDS